MKFEYQLTKTEQQLLDRLNKVQAMTPGKLVSIVLASLVPSVAILIAIDSWIVLYAIFAMTGVLIFSAIRQISKSKPGTGLLRSTELTLVGKHEFIGDSQIMIKWDLIDDIQENELAFIFERLDRYSILPKRAISSDKIEGVREFMLKVRNEPKNGHLPLNLFEELFLHRDGSETYAYQFEEEDLIAATGPLLAHLKEGEFTLEDIIRRTRLTANWFGKIVFMIVLSIAVFLLSTVVADQTVTAVLMIVAMVLPFLFLLVSSKIQKIKSKQNLPRVPREQYRFRLLPDGWAVGEPNAVSFHGWNQNTNFYLSQHFLGIKSDTRLVNLIPNRAFASPQDNEAHDNRQRATVIYELLRNAMRKCRTHINGLQRKASSHLPSTEPIETGNPYQAPQADSGPN